MYQINKWSVITTTLLFLTFWGGILAELILAIIQISISIYLIIHFDTLSTINKSLFISYLILTISLSIIFYTLDCDLALMFMWIIVSMILAYFHLYLTYKIQKS